MYGTCILLISDAKELKTTNKHGKLHYVFMGSNIWTFDYEQSHYIMKSMDRHKINAL